MDIERYGPPRPGTGGRTIPFVAAVRAGDFVFVTGQVATGPDGEIVAGGIVEQTRQTLDNVRSALALAGVGLDRVVKATVWLDDPRDFWSFNKVYAEYFGDALPARSCVGSSMMSACKVEVEVTAYAPRG